MPKQQAGGSAAGDAAADPLTQFLPHRQRLIHLAYRLLGTVHEAEDVVQEVYLHWHQLLKTGSAVDEPGAMLTTLTVRRATDLLRKLSRQREHYVGSWLPSPLLTDELANSSDDPQRHSELASALSIALLRLLETLSPTERAAFVLKQGFDFSYREIAAQLNLSEANCRQLYHRARRRLAGDQQRFKPEPEQHRALMQGFSRAMESGELAPLTNMLAQDAVLYSDGGGNALAALRPIYGADKIGRLMGGLIKKAAPLASSFEMREVNGRPGMIWRVEGRVESVICADFRDGAVSVIYIIRNPDKLAHLQMRQ